MFINTIHVMRSIKMNLVEKLLEVLTTEEDPWNAFVETMPDEHRNKAFCKVIVNSTTPYDVFSGLLQQNLLTEDEFLTCCETLTEEEVIECLREETDNTVRCCLIQHAYNKGYEVIRYYCKEVTEVAIKLQNYILLETTIIDIYTITKTMMQYPDSIQWVLDVLKDYVFTHSSLKHLSRTLYKNCHTAVNTSVIHYVTQLRGISVKEFFLENYQLGDSLEHYEYNKHKITTFHNAGMTIADIVEINTNTKDESLTKWLNVYCKEEV